MSTVLYNVDKPSKTLEFHCIKKTVTVSNKFPLTKPPA